MKANQFMNTAALVRNDGMPFKKKCPLFSLGE